jgi:GABA(A) receptor-associated protein
MFENLFYYKISNVTKSKLRLDENFEKRKEESKRIMSKYPDRIPIICNRGYNSETPLLTRNKFLVPNDLTIGQFMYVIRKHLKLDPEKGLYLFLNNTIPTNSKLINDLYDKHCSEDGFLYITYSIENTFGYSS